MAWAKAKISIFTAAIVAVGTGCVSTIEKITANHDPAGVPSLIGWWKLNDVTGPTIQDTSHFNHNGTPMSHPGTAPGKKGLALALDGRNQYVTLGNIYQGSYKQLSIACWVKHPRTSWQIVVERTRPDDTDGISLMMDNLGESVDFGHYPDFVKSNTKVQDNQWHHLVGTMAPSGSEFTYSIYVDGELDNTTNLTRGLTASTKGWAIGARQDGTFPYRGLIGDVRIYDRALTAWEVRRLFRN